MQAPTKDLEVAGKAVLTVVKAERRFESFVKSLLRVPSYFGSIYFQYGNPLQQYKADVELIDKQSTVYKISAFKVINIDDTYRPSESLVYPVQIRMNKSTSIWVEDRSGLPSILTKAVGDAIDLLKPKSPSLYKL